MKAAIARLSGDRRLQAVLVAFSFAAFIRGGGRVRRTGGDLGRVPGRARLPAVPGRLALPDRQHRPRGLEAIGTPILTLSKVTELDVEALSGTAGRILPPLSFLIPFWLIRTMVGWRETIVVWPALLVIGRTFAALQFSPAPERFCRGVASACISLGAIVPAIMFCFAWLGSDRAGVTETVWIVSASMPADHLYGSSARRAATRASRSPMGSRRSLPKPMTPWAEAADPSRATPVAAQSAISGSSGM